MILLRQRLENELAVQLAKLAVALAVETSSALVVVLVVLVAARSLVAKTLQNNHGFFWLILHLGLDAGLRQRQLRQNRGADSSSQALHLGLDTGLRQLQLRQNRQAGADSSSQAADSPPLASMAPLFWAGLFWLHAGHLLHPWRHNRQRFFGHHCRFGLHAGLTLILLVSTALAF